MKQTVYPAQIKRLVVVNCFGALFYVTCLMQWAWALAPYLPSFIELLEAMNRPSSPTSPPPGSFLLGASLPPVALIIIGALVFILAVSATIYALIALPVAAAKTGHTIASSASKKIVTATPHYKQLPTKQRRQLTARVMLYVKLSLATLPVVVSGISVTMPAVLPYSIVVFIAAALGCAGISLLLAQLVLSALLGVSFKDAL